MVNLALDSATSNGFVAPTVGPNSTATLSIENVADTKAPLLEHSLPDKQKLTKKRPAITLRAFCDEA